MILALFLSAALALLLGAVRLTRAVTCNVPATYATIQGAVDDATCDTIEIAAGEYMENLVIERSVALVGAGINHTIVSGNFADTVISIPASAPASTTVSIADLNIEDGDARTSGAVYGGSIANRRTVTVSNVLFVNNFANSGAGLYNAVGATALVEDSIFVMNWADASGDAIFNAGNVTVLRSDISGVNSNGVYTIGAATIRDSVISGNPQGGVSAFGSSNLTLENNRITQNGAYGVSLVALGAAPLVTDIISNTIAATYQTSPDNDGRGILVNGNVQLTVERSEIRDNVKSGVGIFSGVSARPEITIRSSLVQGNVTGGGIVTDVGDEVEKLLIHASQIMSNTAGAFGGGGVSVTIAAGGLLEISGSEIRGNHSPFEGGGVAVTGPVNATFHMDTSVVAGNRSDRFAGGIYNGGVTSDIVQSAVIFNETTGNGVFPNTGQGGGIYVNSGTALVRLTNSTISGNESTQDGGGIYMESGEIRLRNTTIVDNVADSDGDSSGLGGGLYIPPAAPSLWVTVGNNLIARNTLGSGFSSGVDCYGTLNSLGTNLIGVVNSCLGLVASDLSGTSSTPLHPRIGALSNNGGLSPTYRLQFNSPALDAGQDSICNGSPVFGVDQRAYSRLNADGNNDGGADGDACDIGAFERAGTAPTATATGTATPTTTGTATATATGTTTGTATSTATPGPSPTATNTVAPTHTAPATVATPSATPSTWATATATAAPSTTPEGTVTMAATSTPDGDPSPAPGAYKSYLPLISGSD